MTGTEYELTQTALLTIVRVIGVYKLDWDDFLERIELADAAGPVLDPTLYRNGQANMHKIRELARATQAYQMRIKEILDAE